MELNCAGEEHGLWGDFVSVGGHQVGKTAKNGISAAASSVSGGGTDSQGNHQHSISYGINTSNPGNAITVAAGGTIYNSSGVMNSVGAHTHGVSGTANAQTITGDNETRPVNRGVRYIIKV